MRVKRSIQQAKLFDSVECADADVIGDSEFRKTDELINDYEIPHIVKHMFNGEPNGDRSLLQPNVRLIQEQFNELHEELYRKGGIKPANAAIDEVGKLIFLKIHTEKFPNYRLHSGSARDVLFTEVFNPNHIRENGKKAVRELQDAFKEISVLECYLSQFAGDAQSIFPYQEPLRLEHPDVLALAVEILLPLSLTVPDDELLNNSQKQWETFSHQDLLGSAYDTFLRGKYDSAGGLGTYLTPNQVVDCMIDMAFCNIPDAQLWASETREDGQTVPSFLMGDICCGTGRFPVRALAEVRNRILNFSGKSDEEKLNWLKKMKKHSFLGADQSASSIVKARINFLLFGESHPQLLTVEDSILDERIDHLVGKFNLILTNPPFGEGKYTTQLGLEKMRKDDLGLQLGWSWKDDGTRRKALSRADPALLFIDRNLQLLKPGGLLLIVLPDGILEPAYSYAHQYLLEKAEIKAVVSLPKDTFAITGTVAKTSFILLRKRDEKARETKQTFMAVAEHVGYVKKGTVEVADPKGNDLPTIATIYKQFLGRDYHSRQELNHQPMIVTLPEAELSDSLTAHWYHSDKTHAERAFGAMREYSCPLEQIVSLVKSKQFARTERTSHFISVLHVDERSNVDWEAAASYMPSSKGLRCQPNDVLFSCLNPAKVRVAVVPEDIKGEILCSMEFAIFRPKAGEDPYFIALALRTQTSQRQIIPMSRGTSSSRRRVREEDLLDVIIPYPELAMRKEIATQFRNALESSRQAFSQNFSSLSRLENFILSLVVSV